MFEVDDVDAVVARLRALDYGLVGEIAQHEDIDRLCDVRGRRASSSPWPSSSADRTGARRSIGRTRVPDP